MVYIANNLDDNEVITLVENEFIDIIKINEY